MTRKRRIEPRSPGQAEYMKAMDRHELVFGIGPAGTGKTYLAVAFAAHCLERGIVERIILSRPAVEAGERLGFLPGDLRDKVDPYLRPLYDALYDMMETEKAQRLVERGVIEVAPIAFMRGRTLNDAFVILDEAQNTTPEQMKMFLTRIGFGSKVVVTGDTSPSASSVTVTPDSAAPPAAAVTVPEKVVCPSPWCRDVGSTSIPGATGLAVWPLNLAATSSSDGRIGSGAT